VGTKLRDFLYLDVDRIRSLLAQLEGGIVEQTVDRLTSSKEARAGASLFRIFEMGGNLVREQAGEQTKTLQDALFLLFEESAAASGVLRESIDLTREEAWRDGTIHRHLEPGQLLQTTALTRILDSRHFRERVERFARWPRLVVAFSSQDRLAAVKNPKERERRLEQMVTDAMGGPGFATLVEEMGEFVELFLGGQISIRQFPCGTEFSEFALVGMLLDRPGFLQEEREALFAKYGSAPSYWTMVSQVATVPQEAGTEPDLDTTALMRADEQINRAEFEDLAAQFMQMLENSGIAEGPTFPSVAVTPIAVYREVEPRS
jgi:hypothetical protein